MKRFFLLLVLTALCSFGCAPAAPPRSFSPSTATVIVATATPALSTVEGPTPTSTTSPTKQPRLTPVALGPEREQFPDGVNPLTGLRVADPSMLDLPAVLVSISNSPPTARPQAGTSFASWIFELFIGTGTTRFMGVFYGDLPRRIPNTNGGCEVRAAQAEPGPDWVGNRIWLDENADGRQDPWEAGVAGVCVQLIDAASGSSLGFASSDANGYYFFDVAPGHEYMLQFKPSPAYAFTTPNVGDDDEDSDADPLTGRTASFNGEKGSGWDAGLTLLNPQPALSTVEGITVSPSDIAPNRTYVGPIRSGRLTYNDFHDMFPAGCLVYASAGDGIRQQLHGCEIIFGEQPNVSPNTALLDVSHMKELAQKSKIARQPVNYSGNLFDPAPPPGGLPAASLLMYYHAFAQSRWQYDPVSTHYLRETDDADGKGILHADIDRLTGRRLAFDNVIVILADYQIFRRLQYDVALCCGLEGWAFLFRDGQAYKIRWSTGNRAWEKQSGLRRPIHFIGDDKQPFALKPGRTWIGIMTINSTVKDLGDGAWKAFFVMPNDPPPDE
jgi:hypothetical protein